MSDKICNDHDCPFNHTCKLYKTKEVKNTINRDRKGLECPNWTEKTK